MSLTDYDAGYGTRRKRDIEMQLVYRLSGSLLRRNLAVTCLKLSLTRAMEWTPQEQPLVWLGEARLHRLGCLTGHTAANHDGTANGRVETVEGKKSSDSREPLNGPS
ncbi:uncharacterized protein APUU_31182S [Aspergillus puulaauensis]|uniref:Uncharacterized protein n=1 Tax=Aspergillus puulaauensis TaxID=1220207 RepID=A0A7R7XK36_9EURO|nr:uncharacterized protein APUU_31182S [Aspergillus puulaauensis]BCS22957.1 hypothetical protein APUU_31182S [Aspergillus puulaauensis]